MSRLLPYGMLQGVVRWWGKYIPLFIISFVNNSVAVRHEAWVLISATTVKYKTCGGDEEIKCSNNGPGVAWL